MHTLTLKLKTNSTQKKELDKRFRIMCRLHNVLVKRAMALLKFLDHDKTYQALKAEYLIADPLRKKELAREMKNFRQSIGLSEYGLQAYIKEGRKRYAKHVSCHQVQKEATRVWKGVEKILFSNGEKLHFKKEMDYDCIGGKSNTNGAKFNKEDLSVSWNGLYLICRKPRNEKEAWYVHEALKDEIAYCEIKRKMFNNGWHYYAIVVLKGEAPKKKKTCPKGRTGIDIGTSTVAVVSENQVILKELAPKMNKYNKAIERTLRKMDRSRRACNPNKYNEDGTINRKDRSRWVFSNHYKKIRNRLRTLYRQKSAYIKQSHREMINELIENGNEFYVEKMCFHALQRRAKAGTKKKRFGRSLNNRCPALFVSLLKEKAKQYEGTVHEVDTVSFKASQYDHISDTYTKSRLSQRWKTIGPYQVQRDLYSAYLLMNSNKTRKQAERTRCEEGFEAFMKMHDETIKRMKERGMSRKGCFGF